MNRFETLLTTATLGALCALGTGCTDAETGIFIAGLAPATVSQGSCTYNADPSTIQVSAAIDTGYPGTTGYTGTMTVGNQLIARADADTLKPESNRVQLNEVDVQVFDFQGVEVSAYTVPAVGFVDAAQGTAPSFGTVTALIVDSVALNALTGTGGQTIVSRIVVRGITLGGTEVETSPFDMPINFLESGACELFECEEEVGEPPCFPGNDSTKVDCRVVTGDSTACTM